MSSIKHKFIVHKMVGPIPETIGMSPGPAALPFFILLKVFAFPSWLYPDNWTKAVINVFFDIVVVNLTTRIT